MKNALYAALTLMAYLMASEANAYMVRTEKTSAQLAGHNCAIPSDDFTAMVCAIYFEAGNQSFGGKLKVGQVIRTRMSTQGYPGSVRGVVYERLQFSFLNKQSGKRAKRVVRRMQAGVILEESIQAAKAALTSAPGLATHYYSPKGLAALRLRTPRWAYTCQKVERFEDHIFMRCGGGGTKAGVELAQQTPELEVTPSPVEVPTRVAGSSARPARRAVVVAQTQPPSRRRAVAVAEVRRPVPSTKVREAALNDDFLDGAASFR